MHPKRVEIYIDITNMQTELGEKLTMTGRQIILFRHLPTIDDVKDIYTAIDANPKFANLNQLKILNAIEQIQSFLSVNKQSKILVSDNPRGRETFKYLAERGISDSAATFDRRLNNIQQPEWSGMSQEIVSKLPLYREWHDNPASIRFKQGESLSDVESRVLSVLNENEGDLFIISHTTPMQVILCIALGLNCSSIWSFKFDHYSFSVIYQGVLVRLNAEKFDDFEPRSIRT